MAKSKRDANGWTNSIVLTTFFCTIIAFATQAIWGNAILDHLIISFGFGYSAVFTAHLLSRYQPQLSPRYVSLFSLGLSMLFGTANAYFWMNQYAVLNDVAQLKPIIFLGFIFTTACFFYFHSQEQKLAAQKELEVAKRKQSEHEKALILSQLKQLQSQIEPHFLFNTLANINTLIEHDPASARLMLERLTELLRETLKSSREPFTTLQKDLSYVDAYLAIQKIRLGNRLNYTISNHMDNEVHLPPFLLQPLVENAIQHGIEPLMNGGEIEIKVNQVEQYIIIEVIDNGVGLTGSSAHIGHGVGLDNIRQRLQALFAGEATLTISESISGGVQARLKIALSALRMLKEATDESV